MKCAVLGDSQYVASQGTKIKVCQTCHFKALQTKCQTEALQTDKNLADSQKSCRQSNVLQTSKIIADKIIAYRSDAKCNYTQFQFYT